MNKNFVKLGVLVAVFASMVMQADAQRRGSSRRGNTTPSTTNPANAPTQQVNNNQQPSGYSPYGNLPIIAAPPSEGGFNDSTKKSQRNDGAVEKLGMKDRTPLKYDYLRADDAFFTERVWREIDTREKINQVFNYKADDDNGNQRFINIMVKGVREELKKGRAIAFSAEDDRFTTPLDTASFERVLTGGATCDTQAVYRLDDPTRIDHYTVVCSSINPDDITKFRVKEDWVFDRESSRMVCRIIGIAPLKTVMALDGKTERAAVPMFWIYYPDFRSTLTKYEVYNPKNMGASRMTWEELFESRMFSSYVIKSTIDNPQNRYIRNYIKDPILALLEGDNIKEKIFNFEQDLWSY